MSGKVEWVFRRATQNSKPQACPEGAWILMFRHVAGCLNPQCGFCGRFGKETAAAVDPVRVSGFRLQPAARGILGDAKARVIAPVRGSSKHFSRLCSTRADAVDARAVCAISRAATRVSFRRSRNGAPAKPRSRIMPGTQPRLGYDKDDEKAVHARSTQARGPSL